MAAKRNGRRMHGLWITMMILISGRVTVWPYLEGHRTAQDVAVCGLLIVVYFLGFAGGSRATSGTDKSPPTHE